jgi:hypothetical protein
MYLWFLLFHRIRNYCSKILGSYTGGYGEFLGYNAPTFRRNISLLFSGSKEKFSKILKKVHCRALLAASFVLVYCLAYSSTLKMAAACSSEAPVDFHQTRSFCTCHRTETSSAIVLLTDVLCDRAEKIRVS